MDTGCDFKKSVEHFVKERSSYENYVVENEFPVIKKLFSGLNEPLPEIASFLQMHQTIFEQKVVSVSISESVNDKSGPSPGTLPVCMKEYRSVIHNCYNKKGQSIYVFVTDEDLRHAHESGVTKVLLRWFKEQNCQSGNTTERGGEAMRETVMHKLNQEYTWIRAVNNGRCQRYVNQYFYDEFETGRHNLENKFPFDDTDQKLEAFRADEIREFVEREISRRTKSFIDNTFSSPPKLGNTIISYINKAKSDLKSKLEQVGSKLIQKNRELLASTTESFLADYKRTMKSYLDTKSVAEAHEIREKHEELKTTNVRMWKDQAISIDKEYPAHQDIIQLEENIDQSFWRMWGAKKNTVWQKCVVDWRNLLEKSTRHVMKCNGAPCDDEFIARVLATHAKTEELIKEKIESVKMVLSNGGPQSGKKEATGRFMDPMEANEELMNGENTSLCEADTVTSSCVNSVLIPYQIEVDVSSSTEIAATLGEETDTVLCCNSQVTTMESVHSRPSGLLLTPPDSSVTENGTAEANNGTLEYLDEATGLKLKTRDIQLCEQNDTQESVSDDDDDDDNDQSEVPPSPASFSHESTESHKWHLVPIENHAHLKLPEYQTGRERHNRKSESMMKTIHFNKSVHTFGIIITDRGLRAAITIENVPYVLAEVADHGGPRHETETITIIPLLIGFTTYNKFVIGNEVTRLKDMIVWKYDVSELFQLRYAYRKRPLVGKIGAKRREFTLEFLLGGIIHKVKTFMETALSEKFGSRDVNLRKVVISVPPHYQNFQIQQINDATFIISLRSQYVATFRESTLIAFDVFRKELQESESDSGNLLIITEYPEYIALDLFGYLNDKNIVTISPHKSFQDLHLPKQSEEIHELSHHLKKIQGDCNTQHFYVASNCEKSYSKIIHHAISSSADADLSSRLFQFDGFASTRAVTSVGNYGYWKSSDKQQATKVFLANDRFVRYKSNLKGHLDISNLPLENLNKNHRIFIENLHYFQTTDNNDPDRAVSHSFTFSEVEPIDDIQPRRKRIRKF